MAREIKPYNREAGERLRKIRENRKMSETEMADALGVNPDTYYRLENGVNGLTIDKLLKLHTDYNVDLNYLLTGERMELDSESVVSNYEEEDVHAYCNRLLAYVQEILGKL